jgi:hypothetical protein
MSPTQAREVIEAAGERIADWKSRLRINTGRGVETWDNQGSQLVSVATSEEEVVKEPVELRVSLWVSEAREVIAYPKDGSSLNGSLQISTQFVEYRSFYDVSGLQSGEYIAEEAYKDPDALVVGDLVRPKYDVGTINGVQYFDFSVFYRPQTEDDPTGIGGGGIPNGISTQYSPRQTSKVRLVLSVRSHSYDYINDRNRRGLPIEFSRGQSNGYYDFIVRREERDRNDSSVLRSFRQRVGFAPITLNFESDNNEPFFNKPYFMMGWNTPGLISIVGCRKV